MCDDASQASGVVDALWNRVIADFPTLYWRSDSRCAMNAWFFSKAEGTMRLPPHGGDDTSQQCAAHDGASGAEWTSPAQLPECGLRR